MPKWMIALFYVMSVDNPIEESKLLSRSISKSSIDKDNVNLEKFALIPLESVDSNINRIERPNPPNLNLNDLPEHQLYYGDITPEEKHELCDKNIDFIHKAKVCIENKDCDCIAERIDANRKIYKNQHKHLYPKVVVNVSNDLSDLDSDEEDFHLRTYRKNDSGQGSSVETSSLKSNHAIECYQMNTSCDEVDNNKDLSEENIINDKKIEKNVIDDLEDIDLSSEDKLTVFRGSNYTKRDSPESCKRVKDNNFTDIPLDGSASVPVRPMNTYAPRKIQNSLQGSANGWQQGYKVPPVTDIQPRTRLLKGANQKTWKIFGKVAIPVSKTPSPSVSPRVNKKGSVAVSTTALIFENRPSNLPQKSAKEEQKHREEYAEMINAAKRKELKDKENETKKLKERRKLEDQVSNTVKTWKIEIIPNWENCKNSRKVHDLWWHGVPPSVRGAIWTLAVGNPLDMTTDLYEIFIADAKERMKTQSHCDPIATLHNCESSLVVSKENTFGLIALDVSRTFPSLCIFQKGGPYHEPLKYLLAAYTCHRPDVGYVQGMSFLAAVLLLNMDPSDAFICFSNLLNRPCQMAFFMVDQPMMDAYYRTFDVLLDDHIPRLHLHFKQECLSHDIYLIDWIFTLFSKSLPLDTACRVWDLFCRDGEEFLFRTALGILLMYEELLLEMEFFRLAQYLTKLSNTITADLLFQHIEKINIPKHKFQQTLSNFKMLAKSNPPPT